MLNPQQLDRFEHGRGFIAALDQSGGSTPRALRQYGVDESQYSAEAEMFDIIHAARPLPPRGVTRLGGTMTILYRPVGIVRG